tara:strand:+ start:3206 stop:4096 length:891 start_codon:yes stop_codon:yes gene_type:complete
MKILFIGCVDFSYYALKMLINNQFDIVGLVTKSKSNFNSDFKDLSTLAKNNNIPVFYYKTKNEDEMYNFIELNKPEIIYCFGWSHILKKKIIEFPQYGVVGFHPAKLPFNRGRHPIVWAIALGLTETASTFFFIDEGTDTGKIISQEKIPIYEIDDAHKLYKRIINQALIQIKKFTYDLINQNGKIKSKKQNLKKGNYWRKRGANDGRIDFRMNSKSIYNLIRALSKPYVGAHIEYKNKEVKIWSSEVVDNNDENIEPGKILKINKRGILVKTSDSSILLKKHEFEPLPNKGEYII